MNVLITVLSLSPFISYFGNAFNIKPLNNLQTILSTKAIATAISNRFNTEFVNENLILNDIMRHNTHIEADILYFLIITCYIIYRSNPQENTVIKKLEQFEGFSIIQKRTNKYLFILAIVFTRNIDNAI